MRRLEILLILLGVGWGMLQAGPTYYEGQDVPTDLPGVTCLPWDVVHNNGGVYSVPLSLPPQTPIDALHRMGSGNWLLSVESPTTLGGITWDPSDVFQFDGVATYTPHFSGIGAGVPAGTNVDAAFLDPVNSQLVISFDVPTSIGAATYQPADLVQYSGGVFNLVFNSAGAGLPSSSNLTGADHWVVTVPGVAPRTLMTLDIPTTVGANTYLPGEVLSWDGATFSIWDPQPGWPMDRSSCVNSLSLPADPGVIPPTLSVSLVSATQIQLNWSSSSCAGATEYGIYEGTIGSWYSHSLATTGSPCQDPAPYYSENVTTSPGDHYYLVVPHNLNEEGSYGIDSSGSERAVGATVCGLQVLGCNP